MKKLLVLALVFVLTFSLAVVASAATFDPYVGGRITWAYISSDSTKDAPVTLNNSGIKMLLQGKISDKDTGTWATIGAQIDGWPNDNPRDLNGPKSIYDFGINNIGGSNLSIWYTNWENQNMKRGQGRVYDLGLNYHEDPMFDHATEDTIGFDYVTDNVSVNIGYNPNKNANDTNLTQIAATFKFEGGNVHLGNYDDGVLTEFIVGGEAKLGFGTIKADYVAKENEAGTVDGNIIQAAVFFDALKFDVTVISDSDYKYANGGMGYQVRYTGLADGKMVLAYKAMEADEEADAAAAYDAGDFGTGNFETAYIGYKYGIYEARLGFGSHDDGGANKEDFTYISLYASLW